MPPAHNRTGHGGGASLPSPPPLPWGLIPTLGTSWGGAGTGGAAWGGDGEGANPCWGRLSPATRVGGDVFGSPPPHSATHGPVRRGPPRVGAGAHRGNADRRCRRPEGHPGRRWHGPRGRTVPGDGDRVRADDGAGRAARKKRRHGATRRRVPARARRRRRSLKRLKDGWGCAAPRRMLTPMGLTVASAAPSINSAPGAFPAPSPHPSTPARVPTGHPSSSLGTHEGALSCPRRR